MTPLPLLLLLTAAFLHASWNLRLKQCQQRFLVFWWATAFSSLALLPALLWIPLPELSVWKFVLASAACQALYLVLLSWAYGLADFSLVYPVARGSAPLFLLLWSVGVLHEPLTGLGGGGVVLLSLGLMVLGYQGRLMGRALPLALAVAALISSYTAIDGAAVKHTAAAGYFIAQWCVSLVLALPVVVAYYGRRATLQCLRSGYRDVVFIGLGSAGAYGLALHAYAMAPVAYAGAVREVSVVWAAWLGWRQAGEGGRSRLAATGLIFAGILAIAAS